jgi:hypothetical protein
MTGWGVERTPRTAHRPSPVPPVAVSTLMPPHSQGADRRTGRRASRWGLRALVIGGLAGAAWLLTGAAAHAADRDPAAEGPSLLGSAVHGDAGRPVVTRVLQAAAQPLESDHQAHEQHDRGSVLRIRHVAEAPARLVGTLDEAPTRVVDALDEATHATSDADSVLGGVDRVVRELTAPIRLTGGPVNDRQLTPVTAPLSKVLRPTAGLLPQMAVPASGAQHHLRFPAAAGSRLPAAAGSTVRRQPDASGAAVRDDARKGPLAAPGARVGDRESLDAPQTVRRTTDGDGPAPLRVHLGAVSGAPVAGSGSPTEPGSAAFLPAAVGDRALAGHRLPSAADAAARGHDAEAPTVSPD